MTIYANMVIHCNTNLIQQIRGLNIVSYVKQSDRRDTIVINVGILFVLFVFQPKFRNFNARGYNFTIFKETIF